PGLFTPRARPLLFLVETEHFGVFARDRTDRSQGLPRILRCDPPPSPVRVDRARSGMSTVGERMDGVHGARIEFQVASKELVVDVGHRRSGLDRVDDRVPVRDEWSGLLVRHDLLGKYSSP